jgi:hypothetical protein
VVKPTFVSRDAGSVRSLAEKQEEKEHEGHEERDVWLRD